MPPAARASAAPTPMEQADGWIPGTSPGMTKQHGASAQPSAYTFNFNNASALPWVSLAMSAGLSERPSRKARPLALGA
jgi:hypothetical protein